MKQEQYNPRNFLLKNRRFEATNEHLSKKIKIRIKFLNRNMLTLSSRNKHFFHKKKKKKKDLYFLNIIYAYIYHRNCINKFQNSME